MSDASAPSAAELTAWQRRLASQANNHAWKLAESVSRSPQEDEDMLQAAHAAAYLWKIVGNESQRAHAAQLLAHVYALLKLPAPAQHYLAQAQAFFLDVPCADWERALAHAITANVAHAAGDSETHRQHYRAAAAQIAALPDPEDRGILMATLNVIARP